MNEAKPVCLTIAGLDPSGGAGIIADIRTFASFGCFPVAVVSSLTFQNTTGVFGAVHQTAESIRGQAEPVIRDYEIAALKTGMLPTAAVIDATTLLVRDNGLKNLVVDPVVRSTSGYDLIDDAALERLVAELFPLSIVITPNIPEAERITKIQIKTEDDVEEAARAIQSVGAANVLIKGGHFIQMTDKQHNAVDYLFIGEDRYVFEAELIDTDATHGTGCALSAAIAANLALGKDLKESVEVAKNFVTEAIRTAPKLGHGHSPLNIPATWRSGRTPAIDRSHQT